MRHDDFLKDRYYKMRGDHSEFNTSSHFSHPNAEAGPRNGPRQNPASKGGAASHEHFKIKLPTGSGRREHFTSKTEEEEHIAALNQVAIVIFTFVGSYVFWLWMAQRRKLAIQVQVRGNPNLIYIDKAAMKEMDLSIEELRQMDSQPEKYALSNHLKR